MSAGLAPARTVVLAVGGALVGILVAIVVTLLARPPYATHAELYFKPGATLDATATARVASYAAMVDRDGVTARALPGSLVVRVRAEADGAGLATSRLKAGVAQLREQATANEPATRGLTTAVISSPTTPERGSSSWWPHLGLGLLVGLVVGLLAGAALAIGRRRPAEDDRDADLPVLARVAVSGQVSALVTPSEDETSGLRDLASALAFFDVDTDGAAVVLASLQTDHDGTEVATQLAADLARRDRSVVLVDTDLRHRRVADLLGLSSDRGLVDVLSGESSGDAEIQVHGTTGLHALVAGSSVPDPRALVTSRRLADLVHDLRAEYDLVVLTAAPLAEADDAALLAPATDGLALVVRSGRTADREVRLAVERAEAFGAHVRGLVDTELAVRRPPAVEQPAEEPVVPPVAATPAIEPEDVAEPVPEPAAAAPLGWSDEVEPATELVFPQPLAELEREAPEPAPEPEVDPVLADRFPAQRTDTVDPEDEIEELRVEDSDDVTDDSPRVSLLDDFLTDQDDELHSEPDSEPDSEAGQQPEVATAGAFADDLSDDAETMWRPSHWSDAEKS